MCHRWRFVDFKIFSLRLSKINLSIYCTIMQSYQWLLNLSEILLTEFVGANNNDRLTAFDPGQPG